MLQLKNIVKDYVTGDSVVKALKGVSLEFRESEFVSILGQSGCGKTTMLNIIGGLDRYTVGDLIINGKSTKEFKDSDWDTYRNHSIGFVFQNYNLIPHQSVLANVELALTLSGVRKAERRKRAIEALEKVGLGDQIHKKPNQMSGGQMQRVAIARALVNDPDILLADEPTGALDSETSIQIMDILSSISHEKLIIMVTHNPELADQYSSRIIRLLDGQIISDSNPYDSEAESASSQVVVADADTDEKKKSSKKQKKQKKPSMSFFTALSLSLNNLMTKKGRTFLTAFAGSIGIIGIALILSLSNGIQNYIDDVQEETLSSYPVSIYSQQTDLTGMLTSLSGNSENAKHDKDAVYSNTMMLQLMNALNQETTENNLVDFKTFIEKEMNEETSTTDLYQYAKAIEYSYNLPINAYTKDSKGKYIKADMMGMFEEMVAVMTQGADSTESANSASSMTSMMGNSSTSSMKIWSEILPGKNGSLVSPMIEEQYELLEGSWPKAKDEVILILNKNNEVSDFTLYALGLKDMSDMMEIMEMASKGEQVNDAVESWSYEEILNIKFKLITNPDYYRDSNGDGIWEDISTNNDLMKIVIDSSPIELKVVGVVRPSEDANFAIMQGSLGYTSALSEYIIDTTNNSDIVKAQMDPQNENYDVFTGNPFYISKEMTAEEKVKEFKEYCNSLSDKEKSELYNKMLSYIPDDELKLLVDAECSKYSTRAEKETAIINMSAAAYGLTPEALSAMIDFSSYNDAQVDETLYETVSLFIKAQANADEEIEAIINDLTAEEYATLMEIAVEMLQLGNMTEEQQKQAIVSSAYIKEGMTPAGVSAYVASLTPDELSNEARKILIEFFKASEQYEEIADIKVAVAFDAYINELDAAALVKAYDQYIGMSESSLDENITKLGVADVEDPFSINIYASSFEAKDKIAEIISGYNKGVKKEDQIKYTDYVAILMSSISTVINAISYVLIAFVSISLIVSSIMIAIITYISVLERTKEIGVLRSIGASKKDISRVFNAETVIEGFTSGMIGILVTLLLCIPINLIIHAVTDIDNLGAKLPLAGAIILVAISVLLTVLAGLIPSKIAAKKDPVEALRSE